VRGDERVDESIVRDSTRISRDAMSRDDSTLRFVFVEATHL
jgi:hypothetical protein